MRAGDTDAVLKALGESNAPQAAALIQHANLARQQYLTGLIDADAWSRAQLQLYQEVLEMPLAGGDEEKYDPELLDRPQLHRLVDNRDIASALRLCETLGDDSIVMQAQYEIGRKLFTAGAIGLETWEIIQHKTIYLLWRLAEEADKPREKTSIWTRIGRFLKRR